jgi:hypothetical protein
VHILKFYRTAQNATRSSNDYVICVYVYRQRSGLGFENHKANDRLKDLGVDGRILLT